MKIYLGFIFFFLPRLMRISVNPSNSNSLMICMHHKISQETQKLQLKGKNYPTSPMHMIKSRAFPLFVVVEIRVPRALPMPRNCHNKGSKKNCVLSKTLVYNETRIWSMDSMSNPCVIRRYCLDALVFISIHMYWNTLRLKLTNFHLDLFQHMDWF